MEGPGERSNCGPEPTPSSEERSADEQRKGGHSGQGKKNVTMPFGFGGRKTVSFPKGNSEVKKKEGERGKRDQY